jgi:hypothetical protein
MPTKHRQAQAQVSSSSVLKLFDASFINILCIFLVLGKRSLFDWLFGRNQEQNHRNSTPNLQPIKDTFLFYEVNATISNSRKCKAYRATVYKEAQDCKAYYREDERKNSIYYEDDSEDLKIRLLFEQKSDAFDFQNKLSNFLFDHPTFGDKIKVVKNLNIVVLNSIPERVFYNDYDTNATDSPPFLSLADIKSSHSESMLSNDGNTERAMQSLEDLTLFPKLLLVSFDIT